MANKTISKLSILLSLNADDLKGQADGAKKKLKDLGNGAEKSLVGIRGLSLGMGRLPGGFSAIVSFAGPAIAAIAAFLGGVLAIRSIYSTIRGATDRLEELYNTSVKLGESSLALMSLRKAADEVGAGSATLDMSLQRMTRRISEATLGSGEAVGALKELGLVAGELTVLSPHEALERIAVAMDGVKNNADKTRIAMKLFDSEGVALLNLLPQIAEGVPTMAPARVRLWSAFRSLARPKSISFTSPSGVITTFSAFTSRCTIPAACRASSALATARITLAAWSGAWEPWSRTRSNRFCPCTQGMTM